MVMVARFVWLELSNGEALCLRVVLEYHGRCESPEFVVGIYDGLRQVSR